MLSLSEPLMDSPRTSRSLGDLSQIYRYSVNIAQSRALYLAMLYSQEERGVSITKPDSIRIDNIRIRINKLSLRRHQEISRAYTNGSVNGDVASLPPTPKSRKYSSKSRGSAPPSTRPTRVPRPSSAVPPMKVTNITIKDQMAIVKMQPTSKEPDHDADEEDENDDDIIYPEGVTDFRPYQLVARYRRAVGESTDFRQNPLLVGDDSTETLVLGLNSFAEAHGCQLIFTDEKHQFDNSLYRAASGVVDFGSVHLLATDSILTANFQFEIDLKFEKDMMQSKEKIEKFVMDFCGAISKVLQCEKNEVRVFSINHKDKMEGKHEVSFGLTSPDPTRTEALARDLQVSICVT